MNVRSSLPFVIALAGCAANTSSPATSSTTPPPAATAATAPPTPMTASATTQAAPADATATSAPPAADGCSAPDVTDAADAAPTVTDRVDGCFEPGGKRDVYKLVVPGEGRMELTLAVTGARDRVSTFVDVIGPTGKKLAGPLMATIGKTDTAKLIAEAGTTLLLSAYPNVDPRGPEPWSVAITAAPIPGEPDDDPRPLALGTAHDAAIEPWLTKTGKLTWDVDRYSIEVTTAGTLTVKLDEPKLRARLRVADGAGKIVAAPSFPGLPEPVEATAKVKPGRYTITIESVGIPTPFVMTVGDRSPARSYRLTATVK